MLVVCLGFLTVGYTLLYAGIKNPTTSSGDEAARKPWELWVDAFKQLGVEAHDRAVGVQSALQRAGIPSNLPGQLRFPGQTQGLPTTMYTAPIGPVAYNAPLNLPAKVVGGGRGTTAYSAPIGPVPRNVGALNLHSQVVGG